jgi:hypothetical protein
MKFLNCYTKLFGKNRRNLFLKTIIEMNYHSINNFCVKNDIYRHRIRQLIAGENPTEIEANFLAKLLKIDPKELFYGYKIDKEKGDNKNKTKSRTQKQDRKRKKIKEAKRVYPQKKPVGKSKEEQIFYYL